MASTAIKRRVDVLVPALWLILAAAGSVSAQVIATGTQVDPREVNWEKSPPKKYPWKKKPYTKWNDADLREIAFYSPWSHTVTVSGAEKIPVSIGGGETVYVPPQTLRVSPGVTLEVPGRVIKPPEKRTVLRDPMVMVRWLSSRIMRELAVRTNQLPPPEAKRHIDAEPPNYEILVSGSHVAAMMASCTSPAEQCLRDSALLQPERGTEMQPTRVEFRPATDDATRPEVSFFFDRKQSGTPTIRAKDKKVRFRWESSAGRIEVTFNLKDMRRGDAPDI